MAQRASAPRRRRRSWFAAALLATGIATGLGAPADAASSCPGAPTLAQLIELDAAPGPLSVSFPPVFGTYHERAAGCYGDRRLAFRAFIASPEGLGGASPFLIRPIWLAGGSAYVSTSDAQSDPAHVGGPWYLLAVPPALEARFSGLAGRWVAVTGHFNDRAATTCRVEGIPGASGVPSGAQAIQICRTSFVLDSVVPSASMPNTATAEPQRSPWPAHTSGVLIAVVATLAGVGYLAWRRRFVRTR